MRKQTFIIATPANQVHTHANHDGTITASLNTQNNTVEIVLTRVQALALGARLVDDSASSVLYAIEDAMHTGSVDPLRRYTSPI